MTISLLLRVILIFGARVLDMTFGSFRILMLVRGRKLTAACLGFVEVLIYMIILRTILSSGHLVLLELFAYCGGYAAGNYVGSFLEQKFLSSYVSIEAIAPMNEESDATIAALREAGFGTTVITGQGRQGPRYVIKVVCNRKDTDEVVRYFSTGFVIMSDVRSFSGGYFGHHMAPRK